MSLAEPGKDLTDTVTVHEAYLRCIYSFESCKICPHLSEGSRQLVEDEMGRFEVWAVNIGAALDPLVLSSLDNRLRNSNNTREMVVLLLRALRVNLDYGMPAEPAKGTQADRR
jgi:hypothetical protein